MNEAEQLMAVASAAPQLTDNYVGGGEIGGRTAQQTAVGDRD